MRVLYVDLENTGADIKERLEDLGYGPDDLGNLVALSFPSLSALDSAEGGRHLLAVALVHRVDFVVIDTVSRVISGPENDADTFHALYRHALVPLKARGIAVLRLDHAGKDVERGQRGSSAKTGDVDAVWLLVAKSQARFHLRRQESRGNRGADLVERRRLGEPLRHVVATTGLVEEVCEVVKQLDALAVPDECGTSRNSPVRG